MKKQIFNLVVACNFIAVGFYACSKKDIIDDTPPSCATNIAPANGSNVTTATVTLSWSSVDNATGYDVYIGTNPATLTLVTGNVTTTTFSYTLPSAASTTYYWYVIPRKNGEQAVECATTVTSFTFGNVPGNAININPANGTTLTSGTILLKWNLVKGATVYDVYLGSTPASATVIASNITDTAYTHNLPSATLSGSYSWYVVPKNSLGNAVNSIATATTFNYLYITTPPSLDFLVISYFPSYRSVDEYPDRMFKMCTIINYAFAAINSGSTITFTPSSTYNALYAKAKANGAKVFLSINATQVNFALLKDGVKRNTLIKSIMETTRNQNLDGIDMDYEYPRTTDGTDTIFALLMKELSDSLHRDGKHYLSAAITPGRYAGSIRDGIKDEVFNYIDFFNVMVYDDFNTTVPYKHHSDMNLVNYCMNYWLNTRSMPKNKFVLGIPVYGRNSGAAQISTSYKTIITTGTQLGPTPIPLSDSATLTRTDGSTFTTYYTGQTTVKLKAQKAKAESGGFMFWEMGHDASNDQSLIKTACDAIGRTY